MAQAHDRAQGQPVTEADLIPRDPGGGKIVPVLCPIDTVKGVRKPSFLGLPTLCFVPRDRQAPLMLAPYDACL